MLCEHGVRAKQSILKSGQDRLTLQASLSHREPVKGLDNRQTDVAHWQPGRETEMQTKQKHESHKWRAVQRSEKTFARWGAQVGRVNRRTHKPLESKRRCQNEQRDEDARRTSGLLSARSLFFPPVSRSLRKTTRCMKHHRAPFATVAQFRKPGHRVIVLCRPPALMSHMMQSSSMGLDHFTQNDWGASKAQLCLQLFGKRRLFRDAESPDLQEVSGATNNKVLEDWRTASSLLWLS